jgi:hypothetical protein
VYYEKAKACQFNVIATSKDFLLLIKARLTTDAVLRQCLGLSFFQKLGEDRAQYTRPLFEFAFERYKTAHN